MPKAKKGKKKDDDEWFDSAAEKKIEEQLKALGLDAKDDDSDTGAKKVIKAHESKKKNCRHHHSFCSAIWTINRWL